MRIDFPHFNGDDFDNWIVKVEYYFEVDNTPLVDHVKITALHLEGRAIQWHQGFMRSKNEVAMK